MPTYLTEGFDPFFRRMIPSNSGNQSAVGYDSANEDASVYGGKILGNSIEGYHIKNITADKITTSTLTSPVNVGAGESGEFVKLDGPNNRILIHDLTKNRILIGGVTNSGT